jgi:hypothetical protein
MPAIFLIVAMYKGIRSLDFTVRLSAGYRSLEILGIDDSRL